MFGVAIALLLHQALPGIAIFRGLLLFPYIVPTVVIALIWRWIFNPEIGVVNYALLASGVITERIYWLSTPEMAMASTIMLNVWKYTPFVVICVLARLQTVPLELYDAAKVDGAGVIRRFLDVTLPQLKEVLIVVVVFRTIWTFNKFEEIYLLTKGGPGTSTFNLAVYSFEQSIANLQLGVGAATGVVMMIMLSVGSVIYLRSAGFAARTSTVMSRDDPVALTGRGSSIFAALCGLTFLVCFPLVWALSTSLKPKSEIFATPPTLIPKAPTLENYAALVTGRPQYFQSGGQQVDTGATPAQFFTRWFLNSLVVTLGSTLISIVVSTLAAYSLTRFRYWGRTFVPVLQPARLHGAVDHLRVPAVPGDGAARPDRHAAEPGARLRLHHAAVLHVADVGLHALDPDRDRGGGPGRRRHRACRSSATSCCRPRCPASSPPRSSP